MDKLLIISGPTATGKTQLALSLAKKLNGELVSADSRQVYRGLDVLTGKDINKQNAQKAKLRVSLKGKKYQFPVYTIDGIQVWMYDIVSPGEEFSVSHYQQLAQAVIQDIVRRKKLPILVGGNGLYIRSFTRVLDSIHIPKNRKLRESSAALSVEDLQSKLTEIDEEKFTSMNHSDRGNPRRLIRAIEIAMWKGNHNKTHSPLKPYDVCWVGLTAREEFLFDNIRRRVLARIQGGVCNEVARYDMPGDDSLPARTAFGLTLVQQYRQSILSEDELTEKWSQAECNYAKRQMVWFRKELNIRWFSIEEESYRENVAAYVLSWYTKTV